MTVCLKLSLSLSGATFLGHIAAALLRIVTDINAVTNRRPTLAGKPKLALSPMQAPRDVRAVIRASGAPLPDRLLGVVELI